MFGFPFFYWYQLAWAPLTAPLTYFVYTALVALALNLVLAAVVTLAPAGVTSRAPAGVTFRGAGVLHVEFSASRGRWLLAGRPAKMPGGDGSFRRGSAPARG